MKRLLLLATLVFTILFSSNTFASDDIKIFIDGQQKVFTPGPVIENGSTLVPMRAFFESMGAKVYWADSTKTVTATRNSTTIKLTIGRLDAYVGTNKVYLSAKPQIISEKTYVPLRFISEALGAEVYWNGTTRTITIKDKTKQTLEPFTLVDTQKYEFRTTYSFINNGDKADVEFTVPIGGVSGSVYQKDESISITPAPSSITTDDYGNKFAAVNFTDVAPGKIINIVITKAISNSGVKYTINQNTVSSDYSKFSDYNIYISPQKYIESDNQQIISKAKELAYGDKNPYSIAKKVYEFVNLHIKYDTDPTYAWKGALSALQNGRGVCEEYSKLFVALLRANKVPARSVYGFWLKSEHKDSIGYTWTDISELGHEWPEFYLPGYGWVIAEPTYIYTINDVPTVPWKEFANQNENGHILDGYESNGEKGIAWSASGYGKLNVKSLDTKVELRKVN